MMKLKVIKAIVTGLVIAGVLTIQAYAVQPVQSAEKLTHSDIRALFVDNKQQQQQLAALSASVREMPVIQGEEWLQNIVKAHGLSARLSTIGDAAYYYNSDPADPFSLLEIISHSLSGYTGGVLTGVIVVLRLLYL